MLEKLKLYIKVEKITVFQRRNNVSLSTLNQRQNLNLKFNIDFGLTLKIYFALTL